MYVKVAGDPTVMFDAGDRVEWGTHVIHDGRVELGDPYWPEELGVSFESYTSLCTTGPTYPDIKGSPMWVFGYAYWNTDVGIVGVVTNWAMYIVGDNGKTVDRVK